VFPSGARTLKVIVPVATSDVYSANKKFYLNLGSPVNANVVDGQGAATIVYAPEPKGEYIVDDGDPAYVRSGTWTDLTNTLTYQLDYDYAAAGNGRSTATWNCVGIPNGVYQVFARWSPFSNRATNATYTMLDNGVPVGSVQVNQRLPPRAITPTACIGKAWVSSARRPITSRCSCRTMPTAM
jgi:hypothetical protein